jgi:hypothetical protein
VTTTETYGLELLRKAVKKAWSEYACPDHTYSDAAVTILRELNNAIEEYPFTEQSQFDHKYRRQIRLAQRVLGD